MKEEKWTTLIQAAKNYWIDSLPTGMSDSDFDALEKKALSEGFSVRDYIFEKYLVGIRTKNQWIEKIKKFKVEGITMLEAAKKSADELGIPYDKLWIDLKYDGASIAIYVDPKTGRPLRIVTVGNLNIEDYGVDQTVKLIHHIPEQFPLGIKAIQCEALIDTDRYSGDPDTARQKANGLINSKNMGSEVNTLLTLRAYRYYVDETTPEGLSLMTKDYDKVLESLRIKKSRLDGHIMFAPAETHRLSDIMKGGLDDFIESDHPRTDTGRFLADGKVLYNNSGQCQRALKFATAGQSTESLKTTVQSIQWNDQGPKGKDSWSANVIVDPIQIKGCTIRKPSAGSVSKLVKNNITPGASVSVVLANSTIPMVGEVFSPGNGDYQFPTCACGYKMGVKDVFGSNLKCGNPGCTERFTRQLQALTKMGNPRDNLDLNALLVIDRYKWENSGIDKSVLLGYVDSGKYEDYYAYLDSFLKTPLQKRNLTITAPTSWKALRRILGYNDSNN